MTQRVGGNGTMLGMGEGTRTREREFLVLPDQFKRLRTGQAVVIDPTAKRPAADRADLAAEGLMERSSD